jgi:hypothetical protein
MRVRGFALLAVVSLVGCGGGDKPAAAPPSTAPAASPAAAAAPPAATTAAASGFGVPECDEYITKYLACIDSKVPESARAMVRQGLDQTKASWQQAASTPQGKQGLAAGCKQATEAAKQAMAAYGCSW